MPVTALQQAIAVRQPPPGVVHHSDQGIQYASAEYLRVSASHQMTPSMSRPANPYDNAACESFMKTLKQEEIYCRQYRDREELTAALKTFWRTTTTASGCIRLWITTRRKNLRTQPSVGRRAHQGSGAEISSDRTGMRPSDPNENK